MAPDPNRPSYWRSRAWGVFSVFAAVATFFLWTEHRAHFMGLWPYGLALICLAILLLVRDEPASPRSGQGPDQESQP